MTATIDVGIYLESVLALATAGNMKTYCIILVIMDLVTDIVSIFSIGTDNMIEVIVSLIRHKCALENPKVVRTTYNCTYGCQIMYY